MYDFLGTGRPQWKHPNYSQSTINNNAGQEMSGPSNSSGRAFGMDPEIVGSSLSCCEPLGMYLPQQLFLKNNHSLVENCCCCPRAFENIAIQTKIFDRGHGSEALMHPFQGKNFGVLGVPHKFSSIYIGRCTYNRSRHALSRGRGLRGCQWNNTIWCAWLHVATLKGIGSKYFTIINFQIWRLKMSPSRKVSCFVFATT